MKHATYTGQFRHFLSTSETLDLRRQDRDAVAFLPYREGMHSKARSATVVQFRGDNLEPIAVREDAARLESGYVPEEDMLQCAGEWDFLIRKHKSKEDEVLPVYGESEVEEAEGSTQIEDEEEASEQADLRFLSSKRVAEIVGKRR